MERNARVLTGLRSGAQAFHRIIARVILDDDGQDLVEYMLLGATIALVVALALDGFDDVISAAYASWDAGTQDIWEPEDPM